ncbi:MAG: amidohydrolase family protein [Planctomycetota bacterium]
MITRAIDFHTHAFPDDLAEDAIEALEQGDAVAHLDGTTADLLDSMDRAGIERSVICCGATKPGQFPSIIEWCRQIQSARLIPFPSVHPDDPQAVERVRQVADEGFRGLKLHAYYQDFTVDDDDLFPIYEELQRQDLVLVAHAGFDFAFPDDRRAEPRRIAEVARQFPDLRMVASHLGGWKDWDEVEEHIVGTDIYMETSFGAELLGLERTRQILMTHPSGRLLFGTDSPWTDQVRAVELIESMDLPSERERLLLRRNAIRLLRLEDTE